MNRQRHVPSRQARVLRRPRWTVKTTGCGKRGYPTIEAAIHAALCASRKHGRALRVYLCPTCSKHHLTKRPTWEDR